MRELLRTWLVRQRHTPETKELVQKYAHDTNRTETSVFEYCLHSIIKEFYNGRRNDRTKKIRVSNG